MSRKKPANSLKAFHAVHPIAHSTENTPTDCCRAKARLACLSLTSIKPFDQCKGNAIVRRAQLR
jgi:hypothetical protein